MSGGKGTLWQKGDPLNAEIAAFTVGRDPELDRRLVPFDALGTMAHAAMLAEIGMLPKEALAPLKAELGAIASDARRGAFAIAPSEEDGHTAIENRLTDRLGEVGKRIHTGRSRNDQVICALRLFGRERVLAFGEQLVGVVDGLLDLAEAHRDVVVAGHTHTRQAMPTTVGHWLAAHAESLLDSVPWLKVALTQLNRSPLGSASGYGVALPLDRQRVCDLLAFDQVQVNTLAVQNDRGKTEGLVLAALLGPVSDLARLAADVIWFSSEALGYVELAVDTTTGSSIMPQKQNPDIWELVRAGAAQLRARQVALGGIVGGLFSGYQRDLQLTKEPFLLGLDDAVALIRAVGPACRGLRINAARCAAGLEPAIAATDAVYQRVAEGEPFREVYRDVAQRPADQGVDPQASWRLRTHLGAPGALDLTPLRQGRDAAHAWVAAQQTRFAAVWHTLQ